MMVSIFISIYILIELVAEVDFYNFNEWIPEELK